MPSANWSFLMPAEDHQQLKKITTIIQMRITPWGQAMAAAGLVSLIVASDGTQTSAYLLLSFLLALFLTATILSVFFKPTIEARRVLPAIESGQTFAYKVMIKNTGKHIIRNLSIYEQCLPYGLYADTNHPGYKNSVDWLAPGEEASCTLALRAPWRGTFKLAPLIACSSFPSGIIRSARSTGSRAKFIVYPRIIQPKDLPQGLHRTYHRGGGSQSNQVGDSNEFVSTRDYRPGDRLRDIHWTSTAKRNNLIVREYAEEYFVRSGLYIDTELKQFAKHRSLETRLSLCAGLCKTLSRSDNIIDIYAGERTRHIQSGRGLGRFSRILEFLASIDGDTHVNFDQSFRTLQPYTRELSQLIVLLRDWDGERTRFVQKLKETGLQIKPVIIYDTKTTLPVLDRSILLYETKDLLKHV